MSNDADDHDPDETPAGHVCPECGAEYKLAMQLGLHRKREHGIAGTTTKKPTTRRAGSSSRNESRQTKRRRAIRETLIEFTDFSDEIRGRSNEPPRDLADIIRRDADKIADSLAWLAEKFNPAGWVIDKTMGHGSVVTIARGFMGVGTWMVAHWRSVLADRAAEREEADRLAEMGVTDGGATAADDSTQSFLG